MEQNGMNRCDCYPEVQPDGRVVFVCKDCGQKSRPVNAKVKRLVMWCKIGRSMEVPKDLPAMVAPKEPQPPSPEIIDAAKKLGISADDIGHYAVALAKWTKARFPVREQSEVERIDKECCRPCEQYREGRCAKCGCRVSSSRIAIFNKAKMATEDCPLDKWNPKSPPGTDPTVNPLMASEVIVG